MDRVFSVVRLTSPQVQESRDETSTLGLSSEIASRRERSRHFTLIFDLDEVPRNIHNVFDSIRFTGSVSSGGVRRIFDNSVLFLQR